MPDLYNDLAGLSMPTQLAKRLSDGVSQAFIPQLTPASTIANTTETTLQQYLLQAGFLKNVGTAVRIRAWGTTGATANNKTMKLYFGASVIATPTAATNAKGWWLDLIVIKTGANTQAVFGSGQVDTTPVTPYYSAGADTDTGTLLIKLTGTNGTAAAGDITCNGMLVEYLNPQPF